MDTEVKRGLSDADRLADQLVARVHIHELDRYHTPFGLSIGGGVRYVDSVVASDDNNGVIPATTSMRDRARLLGGRHDGSITPSTTRCRCSSTATTSRTRCTSATLNNSGARYSPGAPRSALLTVNFSF